MVGVCINIYLQYSIEDGKQDYFQEIVSE